MSAATPGGGMSAWRGAKVEPGEGKPDPAEWRPVDLPGRPAVFAGAERVAYRTTVSDPGAAMAVLRLDGLYSGGTVRLDGERVATAESVLDPVRVPFEPAGETELLVTCDAPDDRFGGIHDTDRVPSGDATPGIWWDASVTPHPETFVLDVDVEPRITGVDGADETAVEGTIETRVTVHSRDGVDDRLTLTTRPAGEGRGRGMMDRAAVEAGPGETTTVEASVALRDPSLWYPRGVGPQNRYEVRAKLGDDARSVTTGLARMRYDGDGAGEGGRFTVNGQPVPVRGVTLQDGAAEDVERAVAVNANLVRGHAHALPPAVCEACDAAGVLVWQDLPLTGPGGFDVDRGRALAAALGERYGGHPSLAVVTVHDDPTDGFAGRLGSGALDRLRFRWRVWRADYDRGPAEAVAATVPDGVATLPVVGEPGSDPDAAALYPGWDYGRVDALDRVSERYDLGSVVGEFGAGSFAVGDPAEPAGFDRAKHDAVVDGDGVDASQAYQADLVGTVAERLRADGAQVVVANALRDTGDAGMGVYDRDGDRKRAADALASAFEPVRAVLLDPSVGEHDAVVVNDTPRNRTVTLTWEAGSTEGETDLAVGAAGRATAAVTVPAGTEVVSLRAETGDLTSSVTYDL